MESNKKFISYEYKDITAPRDSVASPVAPAQDMVTLHCKRDVKIKHKVNQLERQCWDALKNTKSESCQL